MGTSYTLYIIMSLVYIHTLSMQSCPKTIIYKLSILVTAGINGCYSGIVRALLYHNAGHRCLVCDTVFRKRNNFSHNFKRELTLLSAKFFILVAWWTPPTFTGTIPKSTYTQTQKDPSLVGCFVSTLSQKQSSMWMNGWEQMIHLYLRPNILGVF